MHKYVFLSLLMIFSCPAMEKNDHEHRVNNEFKLDKLLAELPPELTTEIITHAFPEATYFGSVVMPVPVPQPEQQVTQEAKEYWQEFSIRNVFQTKRFKNFLDTLPSNYSLKSHVEVPDLKKYIQFKNPFVFLEKSVSGPNKQGYFVYGSGVYQFYYDENKKIAIQELVDQVNHNSGAPGQNDEKILYPNSTQWSVIPRITDSQMVTSFNAGDLKDGIKRSLICRSVLTGAVLADIYLKKLHYDILCADQWLGIELKNKAVVLVKEVVDPSKEIDNVITVIRGNPKNIIIKTLLTNEFVTRYLTLLSCPVNNAMINDIEISLSDPTRVLVHIAYTNDVAKNKKEAALLCKYTGDQLIPTSFFLEKIGLFDSLLTRRCSGQINNERNLDNMPPKLLRFVPLDNFVAQIRNNYQQKIDAGATSQRLLP
ncbi:MAG: hypothetical protein ACOYT8_03865 [Candidatus Dependentiae bacterium]